MVQWIRVTSRSMMWTRAFSKTDGGRGKDPLPEPLDAGFGEHLNV
jgi:hypothetical protein